MSGGTHHRPPVIGLTGAIGAGKSTVARMLADLGCLVVDSDDLGRQALRDPAIRERIVREFGTGIREPGGVEINRSRLAAIVFGDRDARRRLEAISHPWIEQRRREQFAAAPHGCPALVIDAPLLIEAGIDRECDVVIFVDSTPQDRLRRVHDARGWSDAELNRRQQAQLPLDAKRNAADYVVTNTGDLQSLRTQVAALLARITEAWSASSSGA